MTKPKTNFIHTDDTSIMASDVNKNKVSRKYKRIWSNFESPTIKSKINASNSSSHFSSVSVIALQFLFSIQ